MQVHDVWLLQCLNTVHPTRAHIHATQRITEGFEIESDISPHLDYYDFISILLKSCSTAIVSPSPSPLDTAALRTFLASPARSKRKRYDAANKLHWEFVSYAAAALSLIILLISCANACASSAALPRNSIRTSRHASMRHSFDSEP